MPKQFRSPEDGSRRRTAAERRRAPKVHILLGLAMAVGAGLTSVSPASAKPDARERVAVRAGRDVAAPSEDDDGREARRDEAELEKPRAAERGRRDNPTTKDARATRSRTSSKGSKDARATRTTAGSKGSKGRTASTKARRTSKQTRPTTATTRTTRTTATTRSARGPGDLQTPARPGTDRFRPSNAGGASLEQRRVLPAQARRTNTTRLERPIEPAPQTRRGERAGELERAADEGDTQARSRNDGDMQQAEAETPSGQRQTRRSARSRRLR